MDFLFGRRTEKSRLTLKRPSLKDPLTSTTLLLSRPLYPTAPQHPRATSPPFTLTLTYPATARNGYDPSAWAVAAVTPVPSQQQWPVGANRDYYNHDTTAYPGPYQANHGSVQNLSAHPHPGGWASSMVHLPVQHQLAAQWGDMGNRFGDLMTLIDCERYAGDETDLFLLQQPQPPRSSDAATSDRPGSGRASSDDHVRGFNGRGGRARKGPSDSDSSRRLNASDVTAAVISGTYFSKVDLYANSRLPLDLPPFVVYMPTWPLLCLAARHSQRVYSKPRGPERLTHVSADWLSGTKAMTVSSVPADHAGAIVLAIRGSASFADWAVNLRVEPALPTGFLDDDCGNACHAGFLSAARSMVRPVARRLRRLLEEDPAALPTASSAGARSELTSLAGAFKRVHCITFGAPPVALLPLRKPDRADLRKSLFLGFINEGDPVARADKEYVKSLLELLARPPPSLAASKRDQRGSRDKRGSRVKVGSSAPVWSVPPVTLCNAGRLVVLRSGDPRSPPTDRKTVKERLAEGVAAATCTPEHLGRVIWGDPVCHLMSLYAARIEVLAVGAVTAKRR
ncbi:hypothetical protein ACCO45_013396 [Purpureocillium lilacinum]|uniref:Uncharacterized protein n=1 Tax=Purpureocillium lilacinum TaxID=33203 RepID=A0ACC4D6A3_PURLI